MTRTQGTTRLDVCAMLLAAALVLAIAVPSILAAREDTRRGKCVDNLRQLGIALQAYHTQHGVLPPTAMGTDIEDLFGMGSGKETPLTNWVQILLPLLGEEELARAFESGAPLSRESNAKARTTQLSVVSCASDTNNTPENRYRRKTAEGLDVEYARGNYALNAGTSSQCYFPGDLEHPCPNGFFTAWTPTLQAWGNGAAGFNKSFSLKDFPSGAGKSVAVDEIRAGLRPVDSRGVWSLGQIGASTTYSHGLYGDDGGPNCVNERADDIAGCGELHEVFSVEDLRRQRMPCCSYCKQAEQATARSLHPGGVNVLTLDGASHFIADNVDLNIWHAIHSREQFDEFKFPL